MNTKTPLQQAYVIIQQLEKKIVEKEDQDIAVIGMSCRFPNADDVFSYWQMLLNGEGVSKDVPSYRWEMEQYFSPEIATAGKIYSPKGAFIEDADKFDANFFDVSPREALAMDPQHRILLEQSWHVFEDAGIAPQSLSEESCGVFVGIGQNDYSMREKAIEDIDVFDGIGNGHCFASGRVAHCLGLSGPTMSIDTACSSSLISIHMACQSLRARECNISLAGGTQLMLAPESFVYLSQSRALTSNEHCRPFDDQADGFMRGEGCAMVLLKRMADAQRDGDHIIAVIKSSSTNHDGRSSGLTVPNGSAQLEVIQQALDRAGIDANSIGYVETHGTGTSLGDPIEVEALEKAYCKKRSPENPLHLGSVKANIGHLEAASGVASFIKCALALKHSVIPQQIHFDQGNKHINWNAPITVEKNNVNWQSSNDQPKRAAVSAFGLSGSNAHLIMEENTQSPSNFNVVKKKYDVVMISAQSDTALKQLVSEHAEYLRDNDVALSDYCCSVNLGRQKLDNRVAFVADNVTSMQSSLMGYLNSAKTKLSNHHDGNDKSIAFAFTGQGSQYSGMGYQLYQSEPLFREVLDQCQSMLNDVLEVPLLEVMFKPQHAALLNQTLYTQPALFVIEYALAKLWQSWGIKPSVVMGHSVGEIAAACFAGVMTLSDGLFLIAKRAELINSLPNNGGMAAIFTNKEQCEKAIEGASRLSVAAYNSSRVNVVAGPLDDLQKLFIDLDAASIRYQSLSVSHAFHSTLMEPILETFENAIEHILFSAPTIPLISNVNAQFVQKLDAEYWKKHIRESVQFESSITMVTQHCSMVLEIGPNPVLTSMAKSSVDANTIDLLNSLSSKNPQCIYESIAQLSLKTDSIDWQKFYASNRRPCQLPKYTFVRESYWPEPVDEQKNIESGTYQVLWKNIDKDLLGDEGQWHDQPCILIGDDREKLSLLKQILLDRSAKVHVVNSVDDCEKLAEQISEKCIVFTWPHQAQGIDLGIVKRMMFDVSQVLLNLKNHQLLGDLMMFTEYAQFVEGRGCESSANIQQSSLWGYWRCLNLEIPEVNCHIVDLDVQDSDYQDQFNQALSCFNGHERQIAIRSGHIYSPKMVQKNSQLKERNNIKKGCSYLITGGLGGISQCVAQWLVEMGAQELILCGRTAELNTEQLQHITILEEQGAKVVYRQINLSDESAVMAGLEWISHNCMPLKGVIHTAGVITEGIIQELSEDHFNEMMRPKLNGTWFLHQYTKDLALDLFVCFSSLSSYTGSTRLSYYAAANAFQDAFVAYRKQMGLAAKTVNWGPWGDRGMMRNNQQGLGNLAAAGVSTLTAGSCKEPFISFLNNDHDHAIICDINWSRFVAVADSTAAQSFYDNFNVIDLSKNESKLGRWNLSSLTKQEARQKVHDAFMLDLCYCLQVSDVERIDDHANFNSLGISSLIGVELCERLSETFESTIGVINLYQYPIVAEMVEYITDRLLESQSNDIEIKTKNKVSKQEPIAIIGLDCRFPQSDGPEAFWQMLNSGESAVKKVNRPSWLKSENTCHAALLEHPYEFDAMFFGISPKEARAMDPLQRLFMEVAWGALEQSGYAGQRQCKKTGIFVGVEQSSYAEHFLAGQYFQRIKQRLSTDKFEHISPEISQQLLSMVEDELHPAEVVADSAAGIGLNEIASRLSHFLDMKGPSMTLNSACSSSIVALQQAFDQIRNGHIDMAIVGGANLCLSDTIKSIMDKAGALSPSGQCSPFDESADGMVLGEGIGAVVLKPLSKAKQDGDYIYSVIREISVNNDGHSQGITVPNPIGQAQCIGEAYQNSGIDPASVSYVECHGTGTPLGDPIEIQSMSQIFSTGKKGQTPCRIGSVKSSIGHMLAASGMGGLIKLCLMFKHQQLLPTVNYHLCNKHIDLEKTPFVIQQEVETWQHNSNGVLRAGLNSFGFGGTNAHVILEQAPAQQADASEVMPAVLMLQATSINSLKVMAANVLKLFDAHQNKTQLFAIINRNQRRQMHKIGIPIIDVNAVKSCLVSIVKGRDPSEMGLSYFQGKFHPKKYKPLTWVSKDLRFSETECQRIAQHYPVFAQAYELHRDEKKAGGYALAHLFNALEISFVNIVGDWYDYFNVAPFKDAVHESLTTETEIHSLLDELTFENLQNYLAEIAASGARINTNAFCPNPAQLIVPHYPFSGKDYHIEKQTVNMTEQKISNQTDDLLIEINTWQTNVNSQLNELIEEGK